MPNPDMCIVVVGDISTAKGATAAIGEAVSTLKLCAVDQGCAKEQ